MVNFDDKTLVYSRTEEFSETTEDPQQVKQQQTNSSLNSDSFTDCDSADLNEAHQAMTKNVQDSIGLYKKKSTTFLAAFSKSFDQLRCDSKASEDETSSMSMQSSRAAWLQRLNTKQLRYRTKSNLSCTDLTEVSNASLTVLPTTTTSENEGSSSGNNKQKKHVAFTLPSGHHGNHSSMGMKDKQLTRSFSALSSGSSFSIGDLGRCNSFSLCPGGNNCSTITPPRFDRPLFERSMSAARFEIKPQVGEDPRKANGFSMPTGSMRRPYWAASKPEDIRDIKAKNAAREILKKELFSKNTEINKGTTYYWNNPHLQLQQQTKKNAPPVGRAPQSVTSSLPIAPQYNAPNISMMSGRTSTATMSTANRDFWMMNDDAATIASTSLCPSSPVTSFKDHNLQHHTVPEDAPAHYDHDHHHQQYHQHVVSSYGSVGTDQVLRYQEQEQEDNWRPLSVPPVSGNKISEYNVEHDHPCWRSELPTQVYPSTRYMEEHDQEQSHHQVPASNHLPRRFDMIAARGNSIDTVCSSQGACTIMFPYHHGQHHHFYPNQTTRKQQQSQFGNNFYPATTSRFGGSRQFTYFQTLGLGDDISRHAHHANLPHQGCFVDQAGNLIQNQ